MVKLSGEMSTFYFLLIGTLSDRELRTLMTKFNDLPLKPDTIKQFLQQLRNCSGGLDNATRTRRRVWERQYGYDLPPVTENSLRGCEPIMKQLNKTKKKESKFKHEIVGEEDIAFKMIKNNATRVLQQLDGIRKNKKKFICLNDNIEHGEVNASVVKGILVDFYESLFPTQSQFELPDNLKNRFLYVDELKSWKNEERRLDFISDSILMMVFILVVLVVFRSPIFYVARRIVGALQRRVRTPRMTSPTSTKLLTV
jgi:UDP-N-acetylglucosamine-lysosomal-enzyme